MVSVRGISGILECHPTSSELFSQGPVHSPKTQNVVIFIYRLLSLFLSWVDMGCLPTFSTHGYRTALIEHVQ